MFIEKMLIIFNYKFCNEKFILNNKFHRYVKQIRHQFKFVTNFIIIFQINIVKNRLIVKFIVFINVNFKYNFRL